MTLSVRQLMLSFVLLSAAAVVHAQTNIRVDFEVNFDETGTGFAPLAGVFHDGSYSAFTPGEDASLGLESLAEIGNPSEFLSEVPSGFDFGNTDGQIGGTNRPLSRAFIVPVSDGNGNFSFAAMFLPSNDWFVSNPGGGSLDISALLNAPAGTQIVIDLDTIYDAGTESEDFTRGGGTGADPFDLVPRLSDADGGNPDDQDDPVSIVTRTPGVNLFEDFENPNSEPIARFLGASSAASLGTITLTVVPEPSSLMMGFAGLLVSVVGRRRRSRAC